MATEQPAATAPIITQHEIAARDALRRIENALRELGAERNKLELERRTSEHEISRLLTAALEAGLAVPDIARLTELSTETLHTRIRKLMQPIPEVHKGLGGAPPENLCNAVLRAMGEQPAREWTAQDLRDEIPGHWPNGTLHQIQIELSFLSKSRQIWRTDNGYRYFPPDDTGDHSGREWRPQ